MCTRLCHPWEASPGAPGQKRIDADKDTDTPEKRDYCQAHNIEYTVLKREPKPGLPRRESTHLRGF